ncbi:MAG: lysophospholipid acyltransferase family protein [Thermodesulfobacteriota bacterium]|nr:lysophospholipid acyltransferase family protein [Thermodesulfobacteriota bacterium]
MVRDILKTLKPVWTLTTTAVYTTVLGTPTIIMGIFSDTARAPFFMGRIWARLIMTTNRVKLQVEGLENVVKHRSYVFISNHASNLDPLGIIRALPRPLRFVGKESLAKIPIFGWAARLGKIIFIDRSDPRKAIETINKAVSDLKDGISAYFFAEGTRSPDGKLLPFKKGGVLFAIRSKLPIVPITVVGSYKLLPKKSLYIKSGILKIIISKPIDTSQYTEQDKDSLLEKVRNTIGKTISNYTDSNQ